MPLPPVLYYEVWPTAQGTLAPAALYVGAAVTGDHALRILSRCGPWRWRTELAHHRVAEDTGIQTCIVSSSLLHWSQCQALPAVLSRLFQIQLHDQITMLVTVPQAVHMLMRTVQLAFGCIEAFASHMLLHSIKLCLHDLAGQRAV